MVSCVHQGNIYIKRQPGVWRDQNCIPLVGAKTPLICTGRLTTPSQGRRYRAETETCAYWGRYIALVPCLHQGNIYIKRELRIWRDQKCIPLVGAKTTLTCAGRQTTLSEGRRYRAENGNLWKLGRIYRFGTVFAPRQYLYQKTAMGMERSEMYSFSRCKNRCYLGGTSNYPVSRVAVKGRERKPSHAMVQCSHQGNIYIKRQPGVWRVKKCIPLVGV